MSTTRLGLGVESSSGWGRNVVGVKVKGQAPQGGRKPAFIHYCLLPHLMTFSTYYNLGFIHIDSHAFTLHIIFPLISLNLLISPLQF